MDTIDFPWKETPPLNPEPTPTTQISCLPGNLRIWSAQKMIPIIFILLMGGLFWLGQNKTSHATNALVPTKETEVLLAIQPVAKNKLLRPEILRPAAIPAKDLTKKQYFERLKQSDLEKLRGKLFTKKDLPLGKPIFWSDVEIKDENDRLIIQTQKSFDVITPQKAN